jgi:serine/threonine protein kinase
MTNGRSSIGLSVSPVNMEMANPFKKKKVSMFGDALQLRNPSNPTSPSIGGVSSPSSYRPSFAAPLSTQIYKEGFLLKKGGCKGGRKNWKRRYFVIKERCLFYYKESKETLLGVLMLDDGIVDKVKSEDIGTKIRQSMWLFSILTTERQIYLAAESEKEGLQWVEALRKCIMNIARMEATGMLKPLSPSGVFSDDGEGDSPVHSASKEEADTSTVSNEAAEYDSLDASVRGSTTGRLSDIHEENLVDGFAGIRKSLVPSPRGPPPPAADVEVNEEGEDDDDDPPPPPPRDLEDEGEYPKPAVRELKIEIVDEPSSKVTILSKDNVVGKSAPIDQDQFDDSKPAKLHTTYMPKTERVLDPWEINYDDLEIFERVGSGAHGEVFRGRLWGSDVAVKKLIAANKADIPDDVLTALKQEISILSQLRHPNVVLYIGACTQPPNVCIVTEWCGRGSLFDVLHDQNQTIDSKMMGEISLQIARGMSYLHSRRKSIIHRDLKSHNILVTDDFTIKVADFGLTVIRDKNARGTTSSVEVGSESPLDPKKISFYNVWGNKKENKMRISLLRKSNSIGSLLAARDGDSGGHYGIRGTPQWMAPEVMEGQRYNGKVDVYSYGIMLTEIFTRKMPYEDKYEGLDFVEAVLEEGVTPTISDWLYGKKHVQPALAKHQDNGSLRTIKALQGLVHSCLSRDPRARPDFTSIIKVLDPFVGMEETQFLYNCDLPRLLYDLDSQDASTRLIAINEVGDLARRLLFPCEICASRRRLKSVLNVSHINSLITEIAGSLICTISVPLTADVKNLSDVKDRRNAILACSYLPGQACRALLWLIRLEEMDSNSGEIITLIEQHCMSTMVEILAHAEIIKDDNDNARITMYQANTEEIILNKDQVEALTTILEKVASFKERMQLEEKISAHIQDKVGDGKGRLRKPSKYMTNKNNHSTLVLSKYEHDFIVAKLVSQINQLKLSLTSRIDELGKLEASGLPTDDSIDSIADRVIDSLHFSRRGEAGGDRDGASTAVGDEKAIDPVDFSRERRSSASTLLVSPVSASGSGEREGAAFSPTKDMKEPGKDSKPQTPTLSPLAGKGRKEILESPHGGNEKPHLNSAVAAVGLLNHVSISVKERAKRFQK